MKFTELQSIFNQHLYLQNEKDFLPVVIATIIANRLDNEPVWLMVIAPPSSGKSKVTGALAKSKEVEAISLLTPNSLMSSAKAEDSHNGKEPSLMAGLNGKNILINDASTITEMHPSYRAQIFSQFRAAFDGKLEKHSGFGRKQFEAKFGFIIAGTMALEHSRTFDSELGERFLYFRPNCEQEEADNDKIWEKIKGGVHNKKVNKELSNATVEFLAHHKTPKELLFPDEMPIIAGKLVRLRAGIVRDSRTRKITFPIYDTEKPWRVAKQLSGLYTGLLSLNFSEKRCMNIIKRVVKHTIPYIRLKSLLGITGKKCDNHSSLARYLGVSLSTARETVDDLQKMGVLQVKVSANKKECILRLNEKYKSLFLIRPNV